MWYRRIRRKLKNLSSALEEAKETWDLYKDKPFWWKLKRTIYINPITSLILDPYYSIRNFFSRVRRICEFIPILWNTHDWDHSYITTIWAYTVKRSKKACIDEGHHVVRNNDIKVYKTVIALLERMSNDNDYTDAHYDYHRKRWNDNGEYEFIPASKDAKGRITSYSMLRPNYERLSQKNKDLHDKEFKAIMNLENYLFKQDVDLLCKLLKKHLRSWWD